MIDRMEILRMALQKSSDPQEALALAREMAAFVAGDPTIPAAAADAAPERKAALLETRRSSNRQKTHWTDAERQRAADLLDQGVSYAEVGRLLGRTARAIQDMRCDNKLPVKSHTLNPVMRLAGALSAVTQGHRLDADTEASIMNGTRK